MVNFDNKLEEKLKAKALEYLEKGRPGWDLPHTLLCVHFMKKLLKHEKGNQKILIPAIYLHDIGSAGLFNKKNVGFDSQQALKQEQMKRSAILSKKILNEISEFSKKEIKTIIRLVEIHDDLNKIIASGGQLVFEADSLGMIDIDSIKPTNFSKKDYLKFLDFFEKERAIRFKTKTGKKFLNKLLPKAKQYYKENM